jgi:hypothetical protein
MSKFKKIFNKMLQEDMTSGEAFGGGSSGTFASVDSYAPGDARIPHSLGSVEIRRDKKKKKKRNNKKRKSQKEPTIPGERVPVMQTRNSGMSGPGNNSGFGFM